MDLAFWLELALFILLLLLSGFFSSSETAMFSLNSRQLEQMRRDRNPRIGLIERMLAEPRRLIVTILIGNEFVNVAASVISAAMIIQLFGPEQKMLNLFVMVPILLVFGEITPKTLAIRNNMAFAAAESRPIDLFARLITPIRWAVRGISDLFTTLLVGRERSRGNIVTDYLVSARMELDELRNKLDIELPTGNYATLAGFILNKLHSVPTEGTEITDNGISLKVHRSSAQTIREVRIRW